ncbi:hypothetical protein [Streptomyces uncialis]|uniref:hypothetical protein n=1 Tax=Streptomyces uncialis TaxID=1048205 RepID=UPI0033F2C98B
MATADQIQRISSPRLTSPAHRKPTPSERKTARTAAHCGALADLREHGQAENGGRTRQAETLRNLTPRRLEAAAEELRRPMTGMGGTARGAGASGGSHTMAVNETVIAMLRPKPDLKLLAAEPAEAVAAARAVVGHGCRGSGRSVRTGPRYRCPPTAAGTLPGRAGRRPTSC